MKNRVGIIGHAAIGKDFYDGQTVSTRLWINKFSEISDFKLTNIVDTYNYKFRFWKILFDYLSCILKCKHIIIMLSGNGLKAFLPLIYYSNKLFGKNFYHRVIGGNLCEFIAKNPRYIIYLNAIKINWVQSNTMVNDLRKMGITNASYLENFRDITPINSGDIAYRFDKPFLFCTFCRVAKLKGITNAINAISEINKEVGSKVAELHIYGPVESDYKQEFESLLKLHSESVKYKGSVSSEKAVDVLKEYYFHLFPTIWPGEGFPGTIIDCYNAGLPTIASNWAYNAEYIHDGVQGYIYDWRSMEDLKACICKAVKLSRNEMLQMRNNNLKEARRYAAENVMKKILSFMKSN